MDAKEEKILALLKGTNRVFITSQIAEKIDDSWWLTSDVLFNLLKKEKISRVDYKEDYYWGSNEATLAFEKKRKEFEDEFGI